MLSHRQGAAFNEAELARSLGISAPTINRYVDTLVDLMLIRRLQPYFTNVDNRLVKTPRVCIRDSGIAHALLNPKSLDDLLGYPVVGSSWEAYAAENLIGLAPQGMDVFFYRTQAVRKSISCSCSQSSPKGTRITARNLPKSNWDCTICASCRRGRVGGCGAETAGKSGQMEGI